MKTVRSLPIGADVAEGRTHFRVWAPLPRKVELVVGDRALPMHAEENGYYSLTVDGVGHGELYHYSLDGEDYVYPDPASRFQPHGPHGRSMVIDPRRFAWTDSSFEGPARDLLIYELHVGTFTQEGTYRAIIPHLQRLADVGVTVIELMPVAEFPGRFGWGYDGVDLFAPSHLYGTPDDLRSLIDAAHQNGIAVILDVVYNHLGPDGNYLAKFSDTYFTDRYENEWGDAINFDGPGSAPVREFFTANAGYWIEEFHFDGLRLDATQQMFDSGERHVISDISAAAREAARDRRIVLVAENEPQEVRTLRPVASGGHGLDLVWNDDFHHSALVALTGRNDAYYTDYLGNPQEMISAAKWGFLYQGQWYTWQGKPRGTVSLDVQSRRFVWYLENHDQIANSGNGERLTRLTDRGSLRAMTALLLLGPSSPMLFQGQEFGSSAPFLYFADHNPELAEKVESGRREFLMQFRSIAAREMQRRLPAPHDPETFRRCKLDHGDIERNPDIVRLHRDLIRLRRTEAAFAEPESGRVDGAVLSPECFLLRHLREDPEQDRLLIVNLGREMHFMPMPEPLLAAPTGHRWQILWSSESPEYGGNGTPDLEENDWRIPGRAALVLAAERQRGGDDE